MVNKVTPLYDLTWFVKWVGTFLIIAAITVRSTEGSQQLDVLFSMLGCACWWFVAFRWHDRALLVINTIAMMLLFSGMVDII